VTLCRTIIHHVLSIFHQFTICIRYVGNNVLDKRMSSSLQTSLSSPFVSHTLTTQKLQPIPCESSFQVLVVESDRIAQPVAFRRRVSRPRTLLGHPSQSSPASRSTHRVSVVGCLDRPVFCFRSSGSSSRKQSLLCCTAK
jgi:hypothetical protein